MNVGVAGANGFIGRALCEKFIGDGNKVYAFFNRNKSFIPAQCSSHSVADLPEQKIDCLFIAIGGHGLSYRQYLDQYVFIQQLIKSIDFTKIIFISSIEVYGRSKETITINSCYNQPNTYGLSKLSQEFLIQSCERFTIIRPTYIYGPGMNENSLIPIWKKAAVDEKEITVFGSGERTQDYLYIDDLAELCFLTAVNNSNNNTVIAATGRSVSNLDLAKEISKNIPETTVKCSGEDMSLSSRLDISETLKLYDWIPKVSIEEGLKKYLAR